MKRKCDAIIETCREIAEKRFTKSKITPCLAMNKSIQNYGSFKDNDTDVMCANKSQVHSSKTEARTNTFFNYRALMAMLTVAERMSSLHTTANFRLLLTFNKT